MPAMRTVMMLALVAAVGALGFAGLFMLRRRPGADVTGKRMARALAWRIGLSVALFLFVLLGYSLGWIRPTGIAIGG